MRLTLLWTLVYARFCANVPWLMQKRVVYVDTDKTLAFYMGLGHMWPNERVV